MARPKTAIVRGTSSFYLSVTLMQQFAAASTRHDLNPMHLTKPEIVEMLIRAYVQGLIRIPQPDAFEAHGHISPLPPLMRDREEIRLPPVAPYAALAPGYAAAPPTSGYVPAPPTAAFVPPAASYPYVQPPMVPPPMAPMPPPSQMTQAPDAPITPAEAASLGSIASVDANEHYKVTNRRRLDFAHHIVANILGRAEDAALLTPHLIDIPSTTFHLPPTGLSQPWGNPDLASREEHARRAFDRGFLKPWLDTGLPALLALAKENPTP